jgi:hypothetical protein
VTLAVLFVIGGEEPAGDRPDAKQRKDVCCNGRAHHALWHVSAGQSSAAEASYASDFREAGRHIAKRDELKRGGSDFSQAVMLDVLADDDELIGTGIWQGMEECRIDPGENRSARTNCHCKRQHRNDTEPGASYKLPGCETKILEHVLPLPQS